MKEKILNIIVAILFGLGIASIYYRATNPDQAKQNEPECRPPVDDGEMLIWRVVPNGHGGFKADCEYHTVPTYDK